MKVQGSKVSKMKNVLMIVIDGLGDEYIEELRGTPLEFASSELETINRMTENGIGGLHWTVKPGIPPSSDKAHLSLFGYDIEKLKVGRGVFEALGSGVKLEKNDVAFRANFATVTKRDDKLIVNDRRAGRIAGDDADKLEKVLKKEIEKHEFPASFKHTVEHRGVLVIKGDRFSGEVSDIDPHHVGNPVLAPQPLARVEGEEREKAKNTCTLLEKMFKTFHQRLDTYPINKKRKEEGQKPANALLLRGGGTMSEVPSFHEKWGMNAVYTAEAALYKGVASFLGMKPLAVEGKLDFSGENERVRMKKALDALHGDVDFLFFHIKLADNFSHSKKPRKKAEYLQNVDQSLKSLLEEDNLLVILTGDHSSSSKRGRHTGMPVPLLFWGGTPRDACKKFNERELAEKGGLGIVRGTDIMPIALDLSDRVEELGIRADPTLPYYKKRGNHYMEIT